MIYLTADHAGRPLLPSVRRVLKAQKQMFLDRTPRRARATDDYPVVLRQALTGFKPAHDRAILLCGSGIGMAMAANKRPGIRAVVATTVTQAQLGRQDEDANVLSLGAWFVKPGMAQRIITTWLATPASQAVRHRRRRRQLAQLDR